MVQMIYHHILLFICGNVRANFRQIIWQFYPEKTGGSKSHVHSTANHTLTVNEMPNHKHEFEAAGRVLYWDSDLTSIGGLTSGTTVQYTWASTTKYVGGGQAHNHGNTGSASNLNPYLTCYIWKRTA